MEDATVVPYGESFLLVGGEVGYDVSPISGRTDAIYQYEILDNSWTLLDAKLPFNRSVPVALMVDIDIFPSCSDGATTTTTTTTIATIATSTTTANATTNSARSIQFV